MMASEHFSFAARATLSVPGHAKVFVDAVVAFGSGRAGDLCFCDRTPNMDTLDQANGSIILCTEPVALALRSRLPNATLIVCPDPRAVFIDFCTEQLRAENILPTDAIPSGFGVGKGARIGEHCVIHALSRIDDGVELGAHCVVHRGVWLQHGVRVQAGTTLGVHGINAYRTHDGRVLPFPHLAGLIIEPSTRIGANAVICSGVLSSTRIGANSVIGNLCNIGHGVRIGERVWMSVSGVLGGHSVIGSNATLGLSVSIRDNIVIGEGAQIGMGSVVVKDVKAGASMFGNPARPVPPIAAGPVR